MEKRAGGIGGRLARYRTAAIAVVAVVAVLVAAIVIPRLGSDETVGVDSGNAPGSLAGDAGAGRGTAGAGGAPAAGAPRGGTTGSAAPGTGGAGGSAATGGSAPGGTGSRPVGGTGRIVRGVSGNKIIIGVGVPDLGVLAAASESFNFGDVQEQMEAILDGWKREKIVPINGRDVEFRYRHFNIVGSDEQIAACNGFVRDDKVFGVLGVRSFEAGADCLAGQYKTPVVHMRGGTDADFKRLHPFDFTIQATLSRTARSFIHWAHDRGALTGKRIGIYYGTDVESQELLAQMKEQLKKLKHTLAVEFQTNSRLGGPQDQVAVQRFIQEDVNVAILLVSVTAQVNFMNTADQQGYKPIYIDLDFGDHTSDAASAPYPPSQYGGTFGVTQTRNGQIRAGQKPTPLMEKCIKNYERYSGKTVSRASPETAEYYTILVGCDDAAVLLRGLQGGGRSLTPESFVAAVETIRDMSAHMHGNLTFTATKHYGVETQRTVQWLAGCTCWKAIGGFEPMSP